MSIEKRRHERQRASGTVTLTAGDQELSGALFDMSKSGMALILERAPDFAISPDTRWRCHISSGEFPTTVTFPARVVRQQEVENGVLLGCAICM